MAGATLRSPAAKSTASPMRSPRALPLSFSGGWSPSVSPHGRASATNPGTTFVIMRGVADIATAPVNISLEWQADSACQQPHTATACTGLTFCNACAGALLQRQASLGPCFAVSPSPSLAATPERAAASRSPPPRARRSCLSSYALEVLSATSGDSPAASPGASTASPGVCPACARSWGSPAAPGRAPASCSPMPRSACDRVRDAGARQSPGTASWHGRIPQTRLASAAGRTVSMVGADLRLSLTGSPLKPAGFPARIDADAAPAGSPLAACERSGRGGSGQCLQRARSCLSLSPAAAAAPARALFGQEEAAQVPASHQRPAGRACDGSAERVSAAELERAALGKPESSARPALGEVSCGDPEAAPATDSVAGTWAHAVQHCQDPALHPGEGFHQGTSLYTSPAQGGEAAASWSGAGLAGSSRGAEARTCTAQGTQEAAPGPGAMSAGGSGHVVTAMPAAAQGSGHTGFSVELAATVSLDAPPAGTAAAPRPNPTTGPAHIGPQTGPPAPAAALRNLRSLSRRRQLRALSASLQHVRWHPQSWVMVCMCDEHGAGVVHYRLT